MAIKKILAGVLICSFYSILWTMSESGSGSGIFIMDDFEFSEEDEYQLFKAFIADAKEEVQCHAGEEFKSKRADAHTEVVRYRFPSSKKSLTPEQASALYNLFRMNS